MKKGFTIIELLVVVAIIGIAASVLVASSQTVRAKNNDSRRLADIEQIRVALVQYQNEYGHYPCSNAVRSDESLFMLELQQKGFLNKIPKDPINTYPYIYWYSSYQSTPGSPCGIYAEVNFDREMTSTLCPNGMYVSTNHCHIFMPAPLPCSNPWLSGGHLPADCANIMDEYDTEG